MRLRQRLGALLLVATGLAAVASSDGVRRVPVAVGGMQLDSQLDSQQEIPAARRKHDHGPSPPTARLKHDHGQASPRLKHDHGQAAPRLKHDHGTSTPPSHDHAPQASARAPPRSSAAALDVAWKAAAAGEWRLCADSYLESYLRADATVQMWYNSLAGFASVLREGHFTPTDYDQQILKQIAEAEDKPLLHKLTALFTAGFISHLRRDEAGAVENYSLAMALEQELSNDEAESFVFVPGDDGVYRDRLVGDVFDGLMGYARKNFEGLARASQGPGPE